MAREGEEKSWGELLQTHVKRRTQLGWNPSDQQPVKFVTRHEMSRKERAFDPILQRFRDESQEKDFRHEESKQSTLALNKSKLRQSKKEQHHDVISHASSLPWIGDRKDTEHQSTPKKVNLSQQGKTSYNIISNIDLSEHHYDHPSKRPKPEPIRRIIPASKALMPRTDFDIISNRYGEAHDSKIELDREQEKKVAAAKYWKTHDFDPITCRFYDPKKETAFQEKRIQAEKRHGLDQAKRLPPCIRDSDGMRCNIISMQPTTLTSSMADTKQRKQRTGEVRSKADVEHAQQVRAMSEKALNETRNFNRSSADRHREMHSYNHGFDIVNSKPFQGRGGIEKPPIRVPERKSLWQKLEAQNKLT